MKAKITSSLFLIFTLAASSIAFAQKSDEEEAIKTRVEAQRAAEIKQKMEQMQMELRQREIMMKERLGSAAQAEFDTQRALAAEYYAMASLVDSPLTEENEKAAHEFAGKLGAAYATELGKLKDKDESKYKRTVWKYLAKKRTFELRAGDNPIRYDLLVQTYKLDLRVEELLERRQNASAAEKTSLRADLRQALGQLFDLREQERQNEVLAMEEKLEELLKTIDFRKKNKDVIVENRLKELLGERKPLEW